MAPFSKFFSLFLPTLLAVCLMSACNRQSRETVTLHGETMGTTYTVKYLSDGLNELPHQEEIQARIDEMLEEVNRQMSTYREDSEISRFNRMKESGKPFSVSADFAAVTAEAVRLNKLTEGALDVTVGPLVNLWGFGPDKQPTRSPSADTLKKISDIVGIDKISLEQNGETAALSKSRPGVYLDLSSIAKGFGVDKLALYLESLGIRNYLVEIGGELRGKGYNRQGTPWHVGIERPQLLQGENTQIIVPLDNRALATSGDYRNFHTNRRGERLSHIIDPQKMEPISHNLASVSVVADSAMTADGLSTGLFVLGEEKALNLAERHGLAVFLIIRTRDGYRTAMSSEFKKLIR